MNANYIDMENEDSKTVQVIGIVVGIAIIGAIICGILECFGVNTGIIGALFGLTTVLALPIFLILGAFSYYLNRRK